MGSLHRGLVTVPVNSVESLATKRGRGWLPAVVTSRVREGLDTLIGSRRHDPSRAMAFK